MNKGISSYANYTGVIDLLIYLCVPVWFRSDVPFMWGPLLGYYLWLFFPWSNNSLKYQCIDVVHQCTDTTSTQTVIEYMDMFCVSNEVFIIAWNISATKRNAEGLEPSNRSMEAQSAESHSEKQLDLSDILNSDYILCERSGLYMVMNYKCDKRNIKGISNWSCCQI